jgi:hypothetical protein
LKCPKCYDEMMLLCRRDSYGFMNELYYRCLACGFIPEERDYGAGAKTVGKKPSVHPEFKTSSRYFWNVATATVLAALVLAATVQIPVPVTVFAAQTSLDPVKDILPYIKLVNFTITGFTLNYTDSQMTLLISADSATVKTIETAPNVTTSTIVVQKALITYRDSKRTLKMGFACLTLTVTIKYAQLLASIDATVILPLWTAIVNRITGQVP